jgi:hypothetical protein
MDIRESRKLTAKTEKQIPRCIVRPPNCGGKEKARDFVRDDTRLYDSLGWHCGKLGRSKQRLHLGFDGVARRDESD